MRSDFHVASYTYKRLRPCVAMVYCRILKVEMASACCLIDYAVDVHVFNNSQQYLAFLFIINVNKDYILAKNACVFSAILNIIECE